MFNMMGVVWRVSMDSVDMEEGSGGADSER